MSKRTRWVLIALGAVLLLGTPLAWWAGQPATQVGEVPTALSDDERDNRADGGTTGTVATTDSDPDGTNTTEDPNAVLAGGPDERDGQDHQDTTERGTAADRGVATMQPVVSVRPARPVSVSLPAIGVQSASVVPVGLDARGAVEIPDDVREVGWYERGPRPGEAGNAFMTSHVDSRTQGRGVLFDLVRSQPGDPIIVTHADGSTSEWVVVARERIEKGSYPMDRVFRFDGPSGLVIDTCGGRFDPTTGSYENIDIVYAEPAP